MRKIFWHVILPMAIIAGANAFDWKTTSDSIHYGNIEGPSAWMIGKRPADHKIVLAGIANFSLESLIYFRGQNQNKKFQIISYGTLAFFETQHVLYGIQNIKVANPSPSFSTFVRRESEAKTHSYSNRYYSNR